MLGLLFLLSCNVVLAAVDPCSEQYPTLGADFVTSQSKVCHTLNTLHTYDPDLARLSCCQKSTVRC